jgi:hypothetical protein
LTLPVLILCRLLGAWAERRSEAPESLDPHDDIKHCDLAAPGDPEAPSGSGFGAGAPEMPGSQQKSRLPGLLMLYCGKISREILAMITIKTKRRNSDALVADRPVVDLNLSDPDNSLAITIDGLVPIRSPYAPAERKAKIRKAIAHANLAYGRALRRLRQ